MNKEIKDQWVKALRSGNYKQGTSYLKARDNNSQPFSYCCLGVLCETIDKENLVPTTYNPDIYQHKRLVAIPSMGIIDKSDLTDETINKLVRFNDSGNKSFNWIAYYINRYL